MKHLKYGLLLFLATILLVTSIPVTARAAPGDTGTEGDFSWQELAGGTVAVTGYSGSATSVTIPDTLNGMTVTAIGDNAFMGKASLTEIIIPSTVTTIGNQAFDNCTSLTTAVLPSALTSIGDVAFRSCALTSVDLHSGLTIGSHAFVGTSLTSLTIPAGVTMGQAVFASCSSLSSLTIDPDCTSLGFGAFYGCTALTSVEIPSGVTALPGYLFNSCTNLRTVVLQTGVQSIGNNAFTDCSNLTGITLPEGITAIATSAFQGSGLVSVALPNSLTSIGDYLFVGCSNLESISFPAAITEIPAGMFLVCTALPSPPIPSTVTHIGASAFAGCSFGDITIPAHVTNIGYNAFGQCGNLTKATILNPTASFGANVFLATALATDGLYGYPGSTTESYASTNTHPFHGFCTVSFDSGGGSAVANIETASNLMLSRPADPVLDGQMLEGWYKDADFTDRWDFAADLIPGDMTLYANWEPVSISGLPGALTTYEGARTTLNPQPAGGAWDWDRSFFSATFNSPATFTALKTGTSVIRYTVYGVTTDITVTVREAALPVTGQSTTWIWVFSLLAIASLGIGIVMKCIKTKEKISG